MLKRLLIEILQEKIIQVPESVKKNIKKLFNDINSLQYVPEFPNATKLKTVFTMSTIKRQKRTVVSLITSNMKDTTAAIAAEGDVVKLVYNMTLVSGMSFEQFYDVTIHELTHIRDPKTHPDLKDMKSKSYKKNPDGSESTEGYFKKPAEFDAFSTQILSQATRNLKSVKPVDKQRAKADIMNYFNAIPKHNFTKDKSAMARFVQENQNVAHLLFPNMKYGVDVKMLYHLFELTEALAWWATKPTLYRRFLQRAYAELYK